MMKNWEQIRSNRLLSIMAVLLAVMGSVQGVIEQCKELYPQYPYFFMLPVYLGKAEVQN